jgi:hypothetical protein
MRAAGARLALEETTHQSGEPRRSLQIALHAEAGSEGVRWVFTRMSPPAQPG